MAPASTKAPPPAPAVVPTVPGQATTSRGIVAPKEGFTSQLSEMEWQSMEKSLENETKATHLNLQRWLWDRAAKLGKKGYF